MYADFPEKYEELREYMRLKHAKELSNRQRGKVKKKKIYQKIELKSNFYFLFYIYL